MNEVTQRERSFLLLLWGLSDPRIAELRKMPKSFIIKLYSKTKVSGRLGMSGGISSRHAQNPLSGERRKTLSITHHALSPPPSHYHLYIIHLMNWLQRFYRIIMSLRRSFVPKSDIKQWFTTTTTISPSGLLVHFHAYFYTLSHKAESSVLYLLQTVDFKLCTAVPDWGSILQTRPPHGYVAKFF